MSALHLYLVFSAAVLALAAIFIYKQEKQVLLLVERRSTANTLLQVFVAVLIVSSVACSSEVLYSFVAPDILFQSACVVLVLVCFTVVYVYVIIIKPRLSHDAAMRHQDQGIVAFVGLTIFSASVGICLSALSPSTLALLDAMLYAPMDMRTCLAGLLVLFLLPSLISMEVIYMIMVFLFVPFPPRTIG